MKLHQGPRLKKLPTAQHILLDALWKKHGGMRSAAKKIGVEEYLLNMWRRRGAVPIKKCKEVAMALAVPLGALNFVEVTSIMGTQDWSYVVKECGFDKSTEAKILRAKPPTSKKGK